MANEKKKKSPSATKFVNKKLSGAVKKLQGGQGGRSYSTKDLSTAYNAARKVVGGKGGRSISDKDVVAFLGRAYAMAKGVSGQGMKPKKKKRSLPKAHPQKGKYKHGGRVRRKAK